MQNSVITPTLLQSLRKKIRKDFHSHYALNDKAHRENHFTEVEEVAFEIQKTLNLDCDPKLIVMGAWLHDLFAWDRKNHHLIAQEWVMLTDYELIVELSTADRKLLSAACGEHRSTYRGKFTSPLSELLSSADRGKPESVDKIMQRLLVYRENKGMSHDEAVADSLVYLKHKYSRTGFARKPAMWCTVYGEQIENLFREIDLL